MLKKILLIKTTPVKSIISFGSNRLNVDISFNRNLSEHNNSNIIQVSERIFELFAERFANLHRTKGVMYGSLKGYQYIRNNKSSFSLKNIPKDKYNEVYQDIFGRWKVSQERESIFIIDWKYYSHNIFDNPNYRDNNRVNASIIKSLAYEFCLSQTIKDEPIHNQFCVPFYDISGSDVVIDRKILDCNIWLVIMNFIKIQEIYLNG